MNRKLRQTLSILLVLTLILAGIPWTGERAEAITDSVIQQDSAIDAEISMTAENSFGKLFKEMLESEQAEQEEYNGYQVFSVEMNGKTATVSMEAAKDCTLVIGIYEEDGATILATGEKDITREDNTSEVEIAVDFMPDYFLLRAFLVETDTMRPLCTVYESSMYTKQMQEFLEKTTDDFSDEQVLNLDHDTANNFAVYNEDIKIVEESKNVNQITEIDKEQKKYIIENADSSVTSLNTGDTFSYRYLDGNILIVKIASIQTEDNKTIITEQDTTMEDVFEYVKIDTESDLSTAQIDASDLDENIAYVENGNNRKKTKDDKKENATIELKFAEFKSSSKKVSLTGSVKFGFGLDIKFYLFEKEKYLEVKENYSCTPDVELSVKTPKDSPESFRIKTTRLIFLFPYGIKAEITPYICIEPSVSLTFKGKITGRIGFRLDAGGLTNLTSMPKYTPEIELEGKMFFGIEAEPEINLISEKIAKASIKSKIGAEVTGKLEIGPSEGKKYIHDCYACIDGDIKGKFSVEFEAGLFNTKNLTFQKKLLDKSDKVADFYYCLDEGKLGIGECPRKKYRITVVVKKSNGDTVQDAVVNNEYETDSNGMAILMLANGSYEIAAYKNGNDNVSKKVKVNGDAKKVVLYLNEMGNKDDNNPADTSLNGKRIKEIVSGATSTGAITTNGELYMWGGNRYGQVGNNTTDYCSLPVKIMDNVEQLYIYDFFTAAVTKDHTLYVWGDNSTGLLGLKDKKEYLKPEKLMGHVKKFASNGRAAGSVTTENELYMWGNNYGGLMGNEISTSEKIGTPLKIMDNVADLYIQGYFSAIITTDNELWTSGDNQYGQLGNGTRDDSNTFQKIMADVSYFNSDGEVSGIITKDNKLYMWGRFVDGSLRDGSNCDSNTPVFITDHVKKAIVGFTSLYLTMDGELYLWGENTGGQIGNGEIFDRMREPAYKTMKNVKDMAYSNARTSAAITEDGELYIWGEETNQFTENSKGNALSPLKIAENVEQVMLKQNGSSGYVTTNGEAYLWGKNTGSGTEDRIVVPTKINTVGNYSQKTRNKKASSIQNIQYTELMPDSVYNFYALKSYDVKNKLDSDNLLYINQFISDANGTLDISYQMKEVYEEPSVFLIEMIKNDIGSANITISDLDYNTEEQFANIIISQDGQLLSEGTDYELSGDYSAKDIGTYLVTISGIGDFTGNIDKEYKIFCNHQYSAWKTVKKATETKEGKKERQCIICGFKQESVISKKKIQKPGKVTGVSIINNTSNTVTIMWNPCEGVSGYQIQYAQNKAFTQKKKIKNAGKSTNKKTISKMVKGKTYYVRVRAYKKVDGGKIFGKWSAVKKVKIKK